MPCSSTRLLYITILCESFSFETFMLEKYVYCTTRIIKEIEKICMHIKSISIRVVGGRGSGIRHGWIETETHLDDVAEHRNENHGERDMGQSVCDASMC